MIKPFTPENFDIPELNGISKKSIEEHLALYQGYVKNFNAITDEMVKLKAEENPLAVSELHRRRSFEFGGMRLHEYYFKHLEGGSKACNPESEFNKAISNQFKSVEGLEKLMKNIASSRGPGWALLYWDKKSEQFLTGFSGEQHQGHFATLPIILALDVWEHTYILDYGAAGRGKYIDAFFANLNWQSVEKNFESARG